MHNQRRDEYKARFLDPKVSAGLEAKALKWNAASRELTSKRRAPVDDPKEIEVPLALTSKLLSVNPDPSHLWNHRRDLLLSKAESSSSPGGGEIDIDEELSLTAACLEKNPKAYGAWFHRKWSVRRSLLPPPASPLEESCEEEGEESKNDALSSTRRSAEQLLRRELDLCAHFLTLDERNFHCWNYRRFVVSALASALSMEGQGGEEKGGSEEAHERADGSWDFWVGDLARLASGKAESKSSDVVMGPQLTRKPTPGDGAGGGDGAAAAATTRTSISENDRDALLRSEWDFTRSKVESNFSNGSAFHYRSKLLPLVLESNLREEHADDEEDADDDEMEADRYSLKIDMAREELDLIRSAVFTEPDDQTSWWYHRFVVAWAAPPSSTSAAAAPPPAPSSQSVDSSSMETMDESKHSDDKLDDEEGVFAEVYLELLEDETTSLRELIEAEGGRCKWGLLALHMVLTAMINLSSGGALANIVEKADRDEWERESDECLAKLMGLDPDRRARYESMMKTKQ